MDIKFKDNSKLRLAKFTKLEYIESTGTQWIDTGFKLNNNSRVVAKFNVNAVEFVFGYRYADGVNMFAYLAGPTYTARYGSQETENQLPYSSGTDIEIDANKNNWSVGSNSYIFNVQTFENLGNCCVFGINRAGSFTPCPGICKFYYFKIYDNGTLVRDFIPAKDTNGVVCLYDTVSETFFYNQGTGDFVAGQIAHSTIVSLPETILLRTTTLYHKNTPNINGLQLLDNILNYQKTHQDEIKEYYYPTTQLWQDIITEYPDILYWYNLNHKLCVVICESDDPEQCAGDFLAAVDDIQQELEDYPDLIPIIVEYPPVASVIAENPSLAPIIAESPEVVHSLVDTEYETWLQADGSSWIMTNYYINGNTDVECRACILNYNQNKNASPMLYGGAPSYQGIGGEMYGWDEFTFDYYNQSTTFTATQVPINIKFKATTIAGSINIEFDNGTTLSGGSSTRLSFTSSVPTVVFALNRGSIDFKSSTSKLSRLKFKEGLEDKLWLVPIQNNGNPCMIDLLTGTKYLNQGTGSFTYSLEPKNA